MRCRLWKYDGKFRSPAEQLCDAEISYKLYCILTIYYDYQRRIQNFEKKRGRKLVFFNKFKPQCGVLVEEFFCATVVSGVFPISKYSHSFFSLLIVPILFENNHQSSG